MDPSILAPTMKALVASLVSLQANAGRRAPAITSKILDCWALTVEDILGKASMDSQILTRIATELSRCRCFWK